MTQITDQNPHLDTLISDGLMGEGGPYLSLTVQRPQIAGNIQKWDILSKNIIQRAETFLSDQSGLETEQMSALSKRVAEAVEALNPQDAHCGGWLMVFGPDAADIFELQDVPQSRIVWGDTPYLLPVLTDGVQRTRGWVLAIGQQQADLMRWDGTKLHDETHRLDHRTYNDMREIREPDSNVNLHTSGALRPNANGGDGGSSATFHAAGFAADDYDEIQMKDYLNAVAKAVEPVIAGSGIPLLLAGDPKTVGWMRQEMELHELTENHIDLAGDALNSERLIKDAKPVFDALDRERHNYEDLQKGAPQTAIGLDAVEDAAKLGKVETIYLSSDIDGFQESEDDERVSLDTLSDQAPLFKANRVVMRTVQQGGDVEVPSAIVALETSSAMARLRY